MSCLATRKKHLILFIVICLRLNIANEANSQKNYDIINNVISSNIDISPKNYDIINNIILNNLTNSKQNLSNSNANNIKNIIDQNTKTATINYNNTKSSIIDNVINDNQYIANTGNIHVKTKIEKIIPLKQKRFVIIIDPGHGGIDPGTIGVHFKTYEKHLTLEYAKSLQKKLPNSKYIVYLTRNNDKFISLNNRRNIAKKYKGDLFISLHFNYSDNYNAKGTSIYTLSEKSYNNDAKLLSERENKVDVVNGEELTKDSFGLADLLIDMIRRHTNNSSVKFAKDLISILSQGVKVIDNAHRFAGFRVLKGFKTPAVLVEVGYLSNRDEEKLVSTRFYKEKYTELVARAIDKYFDQNKA